ncbi:Homeobox protein yox1 [Lithohypha guttulata]|nr:Homeobox protein yox1 [Lithohypha guttulata]
MAQPQPIMYGYQNFAPPSAQIQHGPRRESRDVMRIEDLIIHESQPLSPQTAATYNAPDSQSSSRYNSAARTRKRTCPRDAALLELFYQKNHNPDKDQRMILLYETEMRLSEKELQIWFQNRRQRDRVRQKANPKEVFTLSETKRSDRRHSMPIMPVFVRAPSPLKSISSAQPSGVSQTRSSLAEEREQEDGARARRPVAHVRFQPEQAAQEPSHVSSSCSPFRPRASIRHRNRNSWNGGYPMSSPLSTPATTASMEDASFEARPVRDSREDISGSLLFHTANRAASLHRRGPSLPSINSILNE